MNDRASHARFWLLVGGEAALVAQAEMLASRLILGTPTVADALADLTLRILPGAVAGLLIDRLQFLAKPLLLVGLVLGQLVLGAAIGLGVGRLAGRNRDRAWRFRLGAALAGLGLFLMSGLIVVASGDLPAFGASARGGTAAFWGALATSFLLYGLTLACLPALLGGDTTRLVSQTGRADGQRAVERRRLMGEGLGALCVLVAGGLLARIIAGMGEQATPVRTAPLIAKAPLAALPDESVVAPAAPMLGPTPFTSSEPASPTAVPMVATDAPVAAPDSPLAIGHPPSDVSRHVTSPTSPPEAAPAPRTPPSPTPSPGSIPKAAPVPPTPTLTPESSTLPPGISPPLTPVDQFYVVSKNFVDPTVDVTRWSLEITGLVDRPLQLSFSEFLALPRVTGYVTLECISNNVGGNLISNGLWTGVPFTTLLGRVGINPKATAVNFTAVDNYTESLPLSQALDGVTMLAHSLDGRPLTPKHGAPARLIALNRYGMKNPKWIQRIELADRPTAGYWEARGWDAAAIPRTMTRIDVPNGGTVSLGRTVLIGGVAYAGGRGIARVEVSADEGKNWGIAHLESALASSTWVRWVFAWKPARPGDAMILARATDGTGVVQPRAPTMSFPRGADGYATMVLYVAN